MSDEEAVFTAVLGWRNPEDDGLSFRLYATDVDNSPRWSRDTPSGRVAEKACIERGGNEGDRYLVVRLGDRFTSDDDIAVVLAALAAGDADREKATNG